MVAFVTSLGITLGIFVIWITVLFPNFLPNSTGRTFAVATAEQSNFSRNLADSFSAVKFHWTSLTKFFGQTDYEAPAKLDVVVPDRNVPANPARNSSAKITPKLQ